MKRVATLAGIALWFLAIAAGAQQDTPGQASATDQLLGRLERLSHMQGDFEQRQYDDDNAVLAVSSGGFKLLRPVYFSWEIRAPDRQLIVANADYLWHYDIDLQTATRRPVAGNIEASPLQVLGGDETALREQYAVEQSGADTFTLVPNDASHSFRRLTVKFDGDTLGTMDITDKLGQRVVVQFLAVDSSSALQASDFEFTPPAEGVDLFYYDE
jgi:outer membrane lipoprotein carrier protein